MNIVVLENTKMFQSQMTLTKISLLVTKKEKIDYIWQNNQNFVFKVCMKITSSTKTFSNSLTFPEF